MISPPLYIPGGLLSYHPDNSKAKDFVKEASIFFDDVLESLLIFHGMEKEKYLNMKNKNSGKRLMKSIKREWKRIREEYK